MKERRRWRCWGSFLFAGGDQEDGDVNVGILGLLLAFVSVFALYTVFFVSVFWVDFSGAPRCFFVLFFFTFFPVQSSPFKTKTMVVMDQNSVNYWRQESPTMCKWDYLISHLAHGGGLPLTPINCILMCPPVKFLVCVSREHREVAEIENTERRENREE